jgi:hypothetical protein
LTPASPCHQDDGISRSFEHMAGLTQPTTGCFESANIDGRMKC